GGQGDTAREHRRCHRRGRVRRTDACGGRRTVLGRRRARLRAGRAARSGPARRGGNAAPGHPARGRAPPLKLAIRPATTRARLLYRDPRHLGRVRTMRIGLVVDSACDLPKDFIEQHGIEILPITVRIDETTLVDYRDEPATLAFLEAHIAERGASAETFPFTVEQIRDLFLQKLVIDYDHVFCMTITRTRSPIFENAQKASFAILGEYRPVRAAAGNNTPFALRV